MSKHRKGGHTPRTEATRDALREMNKMKDQRKKSKPKMWGSIKDLMRNRKD
jgi:hypothetical protein